MPTSASSSLPVILVDIISVAESYGRGVEVYVGD